LIKCFPSIENWAAYNRAKLENVARAVHAITLPLCEEPFPIDDYVANVIFVWPIQDGGIVVRREGRIGWIDLGWTGKGFVSAKSLLRMIQTMLLMDIDFLAMFTEQSTNIEYSEVMCRRVGFQEVGSHLFSMRLR